MEDNFLRLNIIGYNNCESEISSWTSCGLAAVECSHKAWIVVRHMEDTLSHGMNCLFFERDQGSGKDIGKS